MRRQADPTGSFVDKGLGIYPEVLACVKEFEVQILSCCEKVLERYLPKLKTSLGMKFQPDAIKRYPVAFEKDATSLEVGIGNLEYLGLGIRWVGQGTGRNVQAYAALYCPRKILAYALSQKLEKGGFTEPEDWGTESYSEWYLSNVQPLKFQNTTNLTRALETSLEKWIKAGNIVRDSLKRLN